MLMGNLHVVVKTRILVCFSALCILECFCSKAKNCSKVGLNMQHPSIPFSYSTSRSTYVFGCIFLFCYCVIYMFSLFILQGKRSISRNIVKKQTQQS